MKLLSLLLLLAPVCRSLHDPHVPHFPPDDSRLYLERRQQNLTSSGKSVVALDHGRTLGPRAVFPEDSRILKMVADGCTLIGMMSTRDEVAAHFLNPKNTLKTAESPWKDPQSIHDWGWDFVQDQEAEIETVQDMKDYLDPVMRDLGLPGLNVPEEGGTLEPRYWLHNRVTNHAGIEYKVSIIASPVPATDISDTSTDSSARPP
jgi:hypothetical protein